MRKQIKIRPGYTPQEDVRRFRGTRQAAMDTTSLPKGHIVGWAPPSAAMPTGPLSKSAKKNQKRREKKKEDGVVTKVKDSWEDEDEDTQPDGAGEKKAANTDSGALTLDQSNRAAVAGETKQKGKKEDDDTDALLDKLAALEVR